MELTPLGVLGDYVLILLSDRAEARDQPEDVVDRIRERYADRLTADDQLDDPDRPGKQLWESRVYLARRYLGDDGLVLSNRRYWTITEAGRLAAAEALDRLDSPEERGPRPVTQTPQQRSLLQPSVIATPLLDPDVRANVTIQMGADDRLPVLVELRLSHPGATEGALAQLQAGLRAVGAADTRLDRLDEYVRVMLTMPQIQDLVRMDSERGREAAVHRIWPDFKVEPLIDLSARTVKVDAARRSFAATGEGITWAVVDSGIDRTHPHFAHFDTVDDDDVRLLHRDFTASLDPGMTSAGDALVDERGHGTHVAGIIAGGLPATYRGKLEVVTEQYLETDDRDTVRGTRRVDPDRLCGMAPHTRLVSLKVLPPDGPSEVSRVIAALRYVREVNAANDKVTRIHGVNLSLGYEFDAKWFACGQSPLCKEVDRLVRSGVVVVVAAGNTGYGRFSSVERQTNVGLTMTINDPGNAARAITVGSTHRTAPHTYGVSYFSSKGPTGDGRLKPDLLAPGERITSCSTGASALRHKPQGRPVKTAMYAEDTGTSFAAPHVSGAIAAFLSVRPEFVAQPEEVKDLLVRTATSLNRERYFEGAGLVDLMRALQAV